MSAQTANVVAAILIPLCQVVVLLVIGLVFRVDRNWENNAPRKRRKGGA